MPKTNNMHVKFLCDKIARFAFEVQKSQSSATNVYHEADQARLASYLDAIDRAHEVLKAEPELDMPKSTPREYDIEAFPEVMDADNESVNMVQSILHSCYIELSEGQSTYLGAGMNDHDSVRLNQMVQHCRSFLTNYIALTEPLDQPESSPMEASTGQGNAPRL